MRQNLGAAVIYNLLAVPLAATGFVAPAMAAGLMIASSLSVTLNAARLHWAVRLHVRTTAGNFFRRSRRAARSGSSLNTEPFNPRHLQHDWRLKPWITITATSPFPDDAFSLPPEAWGSQRLPARPQRGRPIRMPLSCPS